MHTQTETHFFTEPRLVFQTVGPTEGAGAASEISKIVGSTQNALGGLKESLLSSGLVAFNIAAVAAVMGAGFYMILSGKKPKIPLISN